MGPVGCSMQGRRGPGCDALDIVALCTSCRAMARFGAMAADGGLAMRQSKVEACQLGSELGLVR